MPSYAYEARDAAGKTRRGTLEASDPQQASAALAQKGFLVVSIDERAISGRNRAGKLGGRVPETELVMFTRQLATMIDAGLPLVQALTALTEQTTHKNFRPILTQITTTIESGEPLSSTLAKHGQVFDRLYVNMVKAGESGGVLAEILDRLASYLEATSKLKKKVKSSMAYPVIVSIMATLIVIFLLVKVIPVFEGIYKDFNAKLPAPTQLLIDVSHFIQNFWYIVLIGGGSLIFGFLKYIKSPGGRAWWDSFKVRVPVFGPLFQKIAISRFARTFAQLIRSGVPIIETLQIVAASSGNYQVEIATLEAQAAIEKGESIAPALAKHTIFPPMIIRMISAGESTGKVDQMLEKISDFYDSEIDATLSGFTALIEPLMIAVLGVVIGGIVVAMFMPIFKLHEIVSK